MITELEKSGLIRKIPSAPEKADESLKLAERDLKVARSVLEQDYDWAFNIAYNSILQATRALMYRAGYRPSSRNSHIATVKFASAILNEADGLYMDRMRRKRHRAVYDTAGLTSREEAENAVKRAEKILNQIKDQIQKY